MISPMPLLTRELSFIIQKRLKLSQLKKCPKCRPEPFAFVTLSETKGLALAQGMLREGSRLSSEDKILRGVYPERKTEILRGVYPEAL
jgi:hypothetical protein